MFAVPPPAPRPEPWLPRARSAPRRQHPPVTGPPPGPQRKWPGRSGPAAWRAAPGPAADAPDHRTVPVDKGGESRLVPVLDEAVEELPVGVSGLLPPCQGLAQVPDDVAHIVSRH